MEPFVDTRDRNGNLKSIEDMVKEEMAKKKLPFLFVRNYKNKNKVYNL